MMPLPPDAPLSVRLGARLGPEAIATALVVAVVVVGIALVVSGRRAATTTPGTGTAPSASPASSAVAGTSATPAESTPPPPSTPARALLEIVDRLLGQRADLVAEVAKRTTDAAAIADILRDVNASLVLQDGPLSELAADPATADLAARMRTINEATFNAVRRTQRASVSNEKAYRDGAAAVIDELQPLTAIRLELARLAGPAPTPKPAQPTATPAPSGATP